LTLEPFGRRALASGALRITVPTAMLGLASGICFGEKPAFWRRLTAATWARLVTSGTTPHKWR
jgi:hypothetical protein